MYCPNCGKKIPEGSKFCQECGTRVVPMEAKNNNTESHTNQNPVSNSTDENSSDTKQNNESGGVTWLTDAAIALFILILLIGSITGRFDAFFASLF